MEDNVYLEVALKGQIYYERKVIMKGVENQSNTRFDLYCQNNTRPCICGKVKSEYRKGTLIDEIIAA